MGCFWRGRHSVRPWLWQQERIAESGNDDQQVFTVTHPVHPLRGQASELLAVRNNWGGDRVSYVNKAGRLRTLPVEWTDIHIPDPVMEAGQGRARFRADLLRELRRLVDVMERRTRFTRLTGGGSVMAVPTATGGAECVGAVFEQTAFDVLVGALLCCARLAIGFDSEPQQNGGGLDNAAGLSLAA